MHAVADEAFVRWESSYIVETRRMTTDGRSSSNPICVSDTSPESSPVKIVNELRTLKSAQHSCGACSEGGICLQ